MPTADRTPNQPVIEDGGNYSDVSWRALRQTDATIRDATFSDCAFERCTFLGTTFADCSFNGCRFATCDLSLVAVTGSRFMDVRFEDAKLIGVDWSAAGSMPRLSLGVGFERCVVSQSVFFGVDLRKVVMRACTAEECDFRNADLSDADLRETELVGAKFGDTTLLRADLRGARNYAINPLNNRIAKARVSLPDAVALLAGLNVQID